MKMWRCMVFLTCLPCLVAAQSTLAQGNAGTSTVAPGLVASLVPEFVTMDQKLAASDQVFVGTGRRIYVLDAAGREIALDAAGREMVAGDGRQAILEVAIEQDLHAPNSQRAGSIAKFLLDAPAGSGATPVTYGELAARHIGRKGIYFARRPLPPAGPAAGQRPAQPLFLSLVYTPARRGPVENPLPIAELQAVMNAMLINGHSTEDPNCF